MALKEIAKVENMPLVKATATELTISGGVITITQSFHTVDTAADAASDDLDTINGGVNQSMIMLQAANDARTVVLKHNTGNIWNPGASDISLNDIKDAVLLAYDGTNAVWVVLGWVSAAGAGDMTAAVYDPTTVAGDCFDVDNHVDGTTNKVYTATEKTKLAGIEAAADVTDATNVAAAGAVMETDYNADSILAATNDDAPAVLTVGEQTVVGRITGGHPVALTVAQLQTLLFSAALPENVAITLDAALSADGKYSAIKVQAGVLGATVAFGECVYFKVADSQWYLAKADAAATSAVKIGICLVAGNDNDATVILLNGTIRADAKFPSFTVGASVFISAATAGALTSTAPTGTTNFVVRIVGQANTADEIDFSPDHTYLELA